MKRLSDLAFDLRHPWWAFTREVALIHCRRTGQRLVHTDAKIRELRDYYDNHNAFTGEPLRPQVVLAYNINAGDTDAALAAAQRIWRHPR